ncbi:NAD-glutamate dehydrogenase [Sphingomonas rhizophila]|uniref:NAD-glutamate dehydrogenase n=1 Tax=Sphingomonas rhizophila TaxID=2071607 RepID=A0A7G9S9U4_9SPHN|nr:NAD-glutamate dehydrogenase domain-containing protein [Sphingomonas rhizophila]QNN64619.1 NAD-glutamate dehydrogenase [Sphingomonas rhizophila]
MTGQKRAAASLHDALQKALLSNALPGELDDFSPQDQDEAARFVAEVAENRDPGEIALKLLSTGGEAGHRRMRLAVVNDDMPFLVDSVAGAIAARGLTIHRLLHPIVRVERSKGGALKSLDGETVESMIYIELDRADARTRQELVAELKDVLTDVRFAVADWKAMVADMASDARAIGEESPEGAALLDWLADDNFTLLGHAVVRKDGKFRDCQGILRRDSLLWDESLAERAIADMDRTRRALLLLKADRVSPVHRRVPLDVVVVRRGVDELSVHVGLWTSAAMRAPAEEVPILRQRLAALDREFGFSPSSHGAKALAHAVSTLPHDLMIAVDFEDLRAASTTAMSLADRPRPTLLLLSSTLERHLYAFVWLPRDELTTSRRLEIASLLSDATGAPITSWSVELGDGDLALIRFTMRSGPGFKTPDVGAIDARLVEMVRGWAPAVEAELANRVGTGRATRLAFTYLDAIPSAYRSAIRPAEAAEDILRLAGLDNEPGDRRTVRLYRGSTNVAGQLHLNTYRKAALIPLSEMVPVLENFGFRVIDELPTQLGKGLGFIHDFQLEFPAGADEEGILENAEVVENAIASVLGREAEDDLFNQLLLYAGLDAQAVILLRAWFRYLRQTGVAYGLGTVVDALRRAPKATIALIELFRAAHDPSRNGGSGAAIARSAAAFDEALSDVRGIDDDRILRLMRSVVDATLRTNAFSPAAREALAFKFDSKLIPGLPAPIPYREIWVYSPRVEGIHLRGGPIARGGLRWSDRRDDFRTEILGLMKAQLVKNAVIVPTGAKGGFYPKQLPNAVTDRDAWLAEGTESYRIFIRSLLSVTDNIVDDKVVHPEKVVIHDGDDPYFVVAADKGTASFSDVANAIALDRNFWLGDAFASGGSNGYDHKAMGITAKGAWISVQRHFLEMGVNVQVDPVRVAGCGDMSGDVFGNGMLLSKAIQLVAAFDHRHIFIDPNPDPAKSWTERKRMFELPRSSWDDYDRKLLSKGGMIIPRSQKSITLTPQAQEALGLDVAETDPTSLITAILKAPVDLLWFGGIGTYIKSSAQSHAQVGDPANDSLRIDGRDVAAKVIGEGANLAITQAGRIEFAAMGGRINTDFIDNSAGVDCSDNEVNIKIPLNREMREGRLTEAKRNVLLAKMTDDVAKLVLEDNRLQSLALSIAEAQGAKGLPGFVRTIEMLEGSGRLDRKVEGLEGSDALLRRAVDQRGLTRPELAVVLSMAKLTLQGAAEELKLADEPVMEAELLAAFPDDMVKAHGDAIRAHRLRHQIIATKVANRIVNRLGPSVALDLTEEEGVGLPGVVAAFLVAERLLDMPILWQRIERASIPETARIELFAAAARSMRAHLGDIIRAAAGETSVSKILEVLAPGLDRISDRTDALIRAEVRGEAAARRDAYEKLGADKPVVDALVRLYELDGAFGVVALGAAKDFDIFTLTRAYTRLGEVLGLDWAQQQTARFTPTDQWERLLTAGLTRDFEQLRIEFLGRTRSGDPDESVERWVERNPRRIAQFRALIDRARLSGNVSAAMLAQISGQARILLAR